MNIAEIIDRDPGPVQAIDERIDFRFEVHANPEPDDPSNLYYIAQIATFDGQDAGVIDAWTTDAPYAAVEAAREAQEYTLEERLGPYGLEWEREQRDRMNGGW